MSNQQTTTTGTDSSIGSAGSLYDPPSPIIGADVPMSPVIGATDTSVLGSDGSMVQGANDLSLDLNGSLRGSDASFVICDVPDDPGEQVDLDSSIELDFIPAVSEEQYQRDHYVFRGFSDQLLRLYGKRIEKAKTDVKNIKKHVEEISPLLGIVVSRDERENPEFTNKSHQIIPEGTILSLPRAMFEPVLKTDPKTTIFNTYEADRIMFSKSLPVSTDLTPFYDKDISNVLNGARFPHSCDPNVLACRAGYYNMTIPVAFEEVTAYASGSEDGSSDESKGRAGEGTLDDRMSDSGSACGSLPGTPRSRSGTPMGFAVPKSKKGNPYRVLDEEETRDDKTIDVGHEFKNRGVNVSENSDALVYILIRDVHPGETLSVDYGPGYVGSKKSIEKIAKLYSNAVSVVPCTCQAKEWEKYEEDELKLREERRLVFNKERTEVLQAIDPRFVSNKQRIEECEDCLRNISTGEIIRDCPKNHFCMELKPTKKQEEVLRKIDEYAIATSERWIAENQKRQGENEKLMLAAEEVNADTYNLIWSCIGFDSFPHKDGMQRLIEWFNTCGRVLLLIIIRNHEKYGIVYADGELVCSEAIPPDTLVSISIGHLMDIFSIPQESLLCESRLVDMLFDMFASIVYPFKSLGKFKLGPFSTDALKKTCIGNVGFVKPEELVNTEWAYWEDGSDDDEDFKGDGPGDEFKEYTNTVLGETASKLINEEFSACDPDKGEVENQKYPFSCACVLGITTEQIPKNSTLTSNHSGRNYKNFVADGAHADEILAAHPPGTVLLPCDCIKPFPCLANVVYPTNAKINPGCAERPDRVTKASSRYDSLVKVSDEELRYNAIQMELGEKTSEKAKAPPGYYESHKREILKLLADRLPELDVRKIYAELDKRDQEVQEWRTQSFDEFRRARKHKGGVFTPVQPVVPPKKRVVRLDPVDETASGSAKRGLKLEGGMGETSGTEGSRKRKNQPDSDEEGEKRIKTEDLPANATRRPQLLCSYCAEPVKPGDKVNMTMDDGNVVQVHQACYKKTRPDSNGLCYICRYEIATKKEMRRAREGKYAHIDCLNGNPGEKRKLVTYEHVEKFESSSEEECGEGGGYEGFEGGEGGPGN